MITDWQQSNNNGRYILDESGDVVPAPDLAAWTAWFQDIRNRQVALTKVGPVRVSTVFLGLDHNFGGRKPVLWETCCFDAPDKSDHMQRYTSRDEAVRGHNEVVAEVTLLLKEAIP